MQTPSRPSMGSSALPQERLNATNRHLRDPVLLLSASILRSHKQNYIYNIGWPTSKIIEPVHSCGSSLLRSTSMMMGRRTVGMRMCKQQCIDLAETVPELFHSERVICMRRGFAHFGNHSTAAAWKVLPASITIVLCNMSHMYLGVIRGSYTESPFRSLVRTTAEVFRRR
jgi:hypothetical protein